MIILNAQETRQALPMAETIEVMKNAFRSFSSGSTEMPLRTRLPVSKQEGLTLVMPAYNAEDGAEALAVKIISLFNRNPSNGMPLIHAAVLVLDETTGKIQALIEGGSLTAIRTGAGSGAATDVLANSDAKKLAIIGAGVQASSHLEAVCTVRDISHVSVFSTHAENSEKFANAHRGAGPIPGDIQVALTSTEAIQDADIICTTTTSHQPVFEDQYVKSGCHINAVGAYTPEMSEIPTETMARADIYVDSLSAAGQESGEIIQNIEKGAISMDAIREVGSILKSSEAPEYDAKKITLFKSVGIAVQDAAAGKLALTNARNLSLGTEVEL